MVRLPVCAAGLALTMTIKAKPNPARRRRGVEPVGKSIVASGSVSLIKHLTIFAKKASSFFDPGMFFNERQIAAKAFFLCMCKPMLL